MKDAHFFLPDALKTPASGGTGFRLVGVTPAFVFQGESSRLVARPWLRAGAPKSGCWGLSPGSGANTSAPCSFVSSSVKENRSRKRVRQS